MVQVSENPLSNHVYNPDFDGLEYQNFIENTKNSFSEELRIELEMNNNF